MHSHGHNLWLVVHTCSSADALIILPKYVAQDNRLFDYTSKIYCTSADALIIYIQNILHLNTFFHYTSKIIEQDNTCFDHICIQNILHLNRLDIQIYCTRQQVQFALLVEFAIYEILHLLLAINNLCALILKQTSVKILGKFWLISPTTNALQCNVVIISVLVAT